MSGLVLRLDGLPFRVTSEEVASFMSDGEVKCGQIHLLLNRDLKPSGVGYAEVEEEADVKQALNLDGKCIGDTKRYVRIIRTDQEELDWQLARQELYKKNSESATRFYCVRLYGVPYKVGEYEIAKWFLPSAKCVDVRVHLNHEGRPSGDASAYFTTEEEANEAMAKDKNSMNGRYINLAMDSVSVSFNNANNGGSNTSSEYAIHMNGLPFRASEQEIKDFFQPEVNCVSVCVILNRDGRPSGEAIAEFESAEDVEEALKKDREHLGGRFIVLTKEKDYIADGGRRDRGGRRGGGGGRAEGGRADGDRSNGHNNSSSGFSIKMRGIPYRTTESSIMDWFKPEAECSHVRILRNRDNRPSGDAIAEFQTEEDAKLAMGKNRKYMGDRFVLLTPQNFDAE